MNLPIKINFRAFLIVAVCVAVSVLCAYLTVINVVLGAVLFGIFILFAVIAAICVYTLSDRYAFTLVHFFTAILVVIFCTAAYTVAVVDSNTRYIPEGNYDISGRVEGITVYEGSRVVELSHLEFDSNGVDGILLLTVYGEADVEIGDYMNFNSFAHITPLITNGKVDGTAYRRNHRYTASSSNVTVTDGNPNALEVMQESYKVFLNEKLGDFYGGIAYGMITGDKGGINGDAIYNFSIAGISHIIAVSGMHLGFIVLLINLFMRKRSKIARLVVTFAVLLFYVIFAEFTPSIVRSAIMCIIGLSTVLSGKRKDMLSSLCFAFTVILAVKPFYMFEIGFLMSFGALLGIILFVGTFERLVDRVPLRGRARSVWRKFGTAISASASAQIGITPPSIYFFCRVSTYSILVNILIMPLALVAFTSTLLLSAIGWIPYMDFVMLIPKALFAAIYHTAKFTSELPYAYITVYTSAAVFLCYPLFFLASNFTMLKKAVVKPVLSTILLGACVCLMCINVFSVSVVNGIFPVKSYNSTDSVVTVDGKTYVIGDLNSKASGVNVARTLQASYSRSVECIITDALDTAAADEILYITQYFTVKKVYVRSFTEEGRNALIESEVEFTALNLAEEVDGFAQFYAEDGFVGYSHGDALFCFSSAKGSLKNADLSGIRLIRSFRASNGNFTFLTNAANDYSNLSVSDAPYAYDRTSKSIIAI